MEKGGSIWDQSALVKSFDHTVSNYKKMHEIKISQILRAQAEDPVHGFEKNATLGADESDTVVRIPQEMAETENPPPVAAAVESDMGSQPAEEDQAAVYSSEDLDRLLKEHHKVEGKRAKILEQDYDSLNYHYPGEVYGHYATADYQAYYPAAMYVCSGYLHLHPAWQYHEPRDAMFPPTPAGGDDTVRTGFTVDREDACGETEADEHGEEQMTGSTTDLSDVLNAWFSAGLYTGKYLTEQSHSKNTNL